MKCKSKADFRRRRHLRVRGKIKGTSARPRMCVSLSNKHMSVQFVDDTAGLTLAAVSTLRDGKQAANNVVAAAALGRRAAETAKAQGIEAVVFDRGGFKFHGRVRAIADSAREAGLRF